MAARSGPDPQNLKDKQNTLGTGTGMRCLVSNLSPVHMGLGCLASSLSPVHVLRPNVFAV